jgi:hypothetical protein
MQLARERLVRVLIIGFALFSLAGCKKTEEKSAPNAPSAPSEPTATTLQTPLVVIEARDVNFMGAPVLKLRIRITGSLGELQRWAGPEPGLSLPVRADKICVLTKTGESRCQWKSIHFFNAKTKASLEIEYQMVEGRIVPITSIQPSTADVLFSIDPNKQGDDAELLFPGVNTSQASSFQLGALATAKIR